MHAEHRNARWEPDLFSNGRTYRPYRLTRRNVMGFYDCRCMLTGLALDGDATLVMLRRAGDAYRPIALGIAG